MASKDDTVRRRDIVLRYLGGRNGWVSRVELEADTIVNARSMQAVLNWLMDHDMLHHRDTKMGESYRLSGFGRDIYNIRIAEPVQLSAA